MVPCREAVITEWIRLVILMYCYRPQTKFGASSHFQKRVSRILFKGGVPGQVPPWDQVHPPGTRYTPSPRDQVHPHPRDQVPLRPGTPSGTRYPSSPLGPGTPLGAVDTGNERVARILLECILVHISFVT